MSHSANYGEQEIGIDAVAGVLSGLKTINSGMSLGDMAKELGSKALHRCESRSRTSSSQSRCDYRSNVPISAEISQGRIRNNRTEMKFEGVGRRSFSFQFTMM